MDLSVTTNDAAQAGESNNIGLQVSFMSDPTGGAAEGDNMWSITGFASNNADGSGTRYDEQSITLTSQQAGTDLNPGATASIDGLTYFLDLQDGPACSQFEYICVDLEKSSNASPDFELTPDVTTSCTQIECRGTNQNIK